MEYRITKLFKDFVSKGSTSGILLILCTLVSLIIANSGAGESYTHFWHEKIDLSFGPINLNYSIEHWINDGLMTFFFLMVGLEIKREFVVGELSETKHALLPFLAATGGMIFPALIYLLFNNGLPTQSGFGIPMATDIAFSLGILSLFGKQIPVSLKIFLTALAIIDDLGAIVIIAIFYSSGLSWLFLSLAAGILALLLVLNRLKVYNRWVYVLPGIALWYCMIQSGVHATIAGVLLAFLMPFAKAEIKCPSRRVQSKLHIPVSFVIMPLFALCNTTLIIPSGWESSLTTPHSMGILLGLFIGKPLGILLLSWITLKSGIAALPEHTTWNQLTGVAVLAGIGFTMSIFISNLAFNDAAIITISKVNILLASLTAGIAGFLILRFSRRKLSVLAVKQNK